MPNVLSGVMPASTTGAIVDSATYGIATLAPVTELLAGIFLAFLVIQILFDAIGKKVGGQVEPAYEEEDEGGII